MNLYKDILIKALSNSSIKITFENLTTENPEKIVESVCYKTIQKIRTILDDDGLDDFECVERIILLLEEIGSDGGSRHDFG